MFSRRGVVIHPFELSQAWLDTARQLDLNVLALHPPGGPRAEEHLQAMLDQLRESETQALLAQARRQGMQVEYEMHALSYLMPRTLFASHPEWFRMDAQGERVADFNLCASSQEALGYLADQAEALARLLPAESHRYYFWLDDVTAARCHCPQCRELSASEQQLLCVNAMLAGIRRTDPQGMLAYIAYLDAMEPPRRVKPASGVFLEYAPIKRRLDRPLTDSDCAENAREFAPLPELLACFGATHAQALDYWLDNSLLSGWQYPPKPFRLNGEVVRADTEAYHALGIDSVTCFACYLGPDYVALHGTPDLRAYGNALHGSA